MLGRTCCSLEADSVGCKNWKVSCTKAFIFATFFYLPKMYVVISKIFKSTQKFAAWSTLKFISGLCPIIQKVVFSKRKVKGGVFQMHEKDLSGQNTADPSFLVS